MLKLGRYWPWKTLSSHLKPTTCVWQFEVKTFKLDQRYWCGLIAFGQTEIILLHFFFLFLFELRIVSGLPEGESVLVQYIPIYRYDTRIIRGDRKTDESESHAEFHLCWMHRPINGLKVEELAFSCFPFNNVKLRFGSRCPGRASSETNRIRFTAKGKRLIVPRDKVFPLFIVYCLLHLLKISCSIFQVYPNYFGRFWIGEIVNFISCWLLPWKWF